MAIAVREIARRSIRLDAKPVPALGRCLTDIRKRKRFSQRELADMAGISNTYLRSIEDGYDPRTGKEVRPSPDVLRPLAEALAYSDSDPLEAERIFAKLMDAAGWLPKLLPKEDSDRMARESEDRIRRQKEILDRVRELLDEADSETGHI